MIDLSRPPARACSDHRLTLTSGLPVTTADVTGATSIFLTPAGGGNQILLFTPAGIAVNVVLTEQQMALGTLTSGKPYDKFIWWDGGFQHESVVWTDDTTRVTALTFANGFRVKTGATYKRYIGSFYTSSTTTTEDTGGGIDTTPLRYLFNMHNRVARPMFVSDSTNGWTTTHDATFRAARSSSTNRLKFLIGVSEEPVLAEVQAIAGQATSAAGVAVGIGLDSTSVNSGRTFGGAINAGDYGLPQSRFRAPVAAGLHYLQWLELSDTATTTWQGDGGVTYYRSGMTGEVWQ